MERMTRISQISRKTKGEWVIFEYMGYKCDFCEGNFCDRVYYKSVLDRMLAEVAMMDCKLYQTFLDIQQVYEL